MHHRVGAIIGVMIGSNAEEDGIDGTVVLLRHPHHHLFTNGNIQEIGIPNKLSSSKTFANRITVTSRVIPKCRSTIRSARYQHLLSRKGRDYLKIKTLDSRMYRGRLKIETIDSKINNAMKLVSKVVHPRLNRKHLKKVV